MESEADRDLAILQGQWKQIGFEENGLDALTSEHGAASAITTINGCQFSVRASDGELLLAGTFTLDASVRPKAITRMDSIGADAGKRLPASYALNSDHFVFIAADEGASRPTEFRTKPGQILRRFVRKR